jgi:hypothetical protein
MLKDNNPMLVFRAISDSNYGTTYVFGDIRAPNLVWVVFRGTANAKSALAYSRPSSLTPTALANFYGIIDAGLIGIFKILQEQIHVIIQMAVDVATELNPGVALAPGSIKLLTTGHSLGGAMATAFAGEYVQQISSDLTRIVGASIFDVNIGCYSLASPRVFGPKEAGIFCCLTQAGDLCKKDPKASEYQAVALKVPGRISYLRVVTTLDLVTALPKVGYEHPCSEFDDGERDMITMDCDIEKNGFITNKASTRCLIEHKRPAMTANFSKAPVCTDKRKKTWSISSMLYHLTYCGIMFAGGVDMSSALSLDVERLQPEDVTSAAVNPKELGIKEDNTMMRILWYGFNQAAIAKCVFFDLAPFRVNETMVQSGGQKGGWPWNKGDNKVAPEPQSAAPAAAAAPQAAPQAAPKTFFSRFGKKIDAIAVPAAAAPTPTQPDSLLEDSKMTNAFIVGLKKAIMVDDKYTYPITDVAFKPPILYKPLPSKGVVPPPQDYNYLYQLPDISTSGSRFTLFFGKAQGPPRAYDASGNFILHPHEEIEVDDHVNFHNKLVSADANTAVAVINAADPLNANPLVLPPVPSIPSPPNLLSKLNPQLAPAVAAPAVAATAAQPPAVAAPAVAATAVAATAAQLPAVAAPAKGGKRTRRKGLLKSRKHKKGKKVARVSRRKHRSRTKRH